MGYVGALLRKGLKIIKNYELKWDYMAEVFFGKCGKLPTVVFNWVRQLAAAVDCFDGTKYNVFSVSTDSVLFLHPV